MSVSQWTDNGIDGDPAFGNKCPTAWWTWGRCAKTTRGSASYAHHFRGRFDTDASLFGDVDGVVVDIVAAATASFGSGAAHVVE